MRLTRPAVLTASTLAGCAAALVAYNASAPSPVAPTTAPVAAVAKAEPRVVFAPCVAPAKLERGACVTHVTKTTYVALPSPDYGTVRPATAPARPASAPAPSRSQSAPQTPDSEPGEHESEHEDHDGEDREHEGVDD